MKELRYLVTLALCLLVVGCATSGSAKLPAHQIVIEDGFGSVSSLNPYEDPSWPTGAVTAELALAFLFRSDAPASALKPDLAIEIPTVANRGLSRDGLTITYRLRPRLRWSDGAPLTSADIAFTVRAILDPANNTVPGDFSDIEHIDTPDPQTAIFHLKHPFADFLSSFFSTGGPGGVTPLLPMHAFKGTKMKGAAFSSRPVGAGPFRVVSWRRDERITFERNPYYWGKPAKLQSVQYAIRSSIETADVDYLAHGSQLFERIPESKIASAEAAGPVTLTAPDAYLHLDFNVRRPAVASAKIRRAILLSLDRPAIARDASHGYGLTQEGVVSRANLLNIDIPFLGTNLAEARHLLGGHAPTLLLTYPAGDDMLAVVAELTRAQLGRTGINLQTHAYNPQLYYNTILPQGKWDMTMFNWTLDPSGNIESLFSCRNFSPDGQNDMFYCNSRLDALFARYDTALDSSLRRSLLRQEERIIDDDTPTIVVFFRRFGYGSAPGLTGFHPAADSPFDGFEQVDYQ